MRCGIDEAGRGPLAGPVYAAAVVLGARGLAIKGIDDSKKLSEASRDALALEIKENALAWSITAIDANTIDCINILQATLKGMHEAFNALHARDEVREIVIDGTQLPKALVAWCKTQSIALRALPKADATVKEVGAASILAKTARDEFMIAMDSKFPGYGFAQHKGYGTQQHMDAIARLGPCELHRKTFAPIAQYSLL
ncbi:MAG: ribonuclease HII [Casimicrobium sp.]